MHLAHFLKIRLVWALFKHFSTVSNQMLPILEHSKGAKNSLIFQKCAKCTLTLMSNYEIIFVYKFRFYTSKMNEICLHCHWLYFSSITMSFGQGEKICFTIERNVFCFNLVILQSTNMPGILKSSIFE